MSRRAQPFTQTDVTRAAKGAVKAGLTVRRVEICEGKIVIIAGPPEEPPANENEWDGVK
jgi:hypothetical protein